MIFRYFDAAGSQWDVCEWATIRKGLEWRRVPYNKRVVRIEAYEQSKMVHQWKLDYFNNRMKRISIKNKA